MKKTVRLFGILLLAACILHCGGDKREKTVTPGNTPPAITEITLLPMKPTVQTEITARILSVDDDGDQVTYEMKWFVNGRQIGEGMSFAYDEVQKGDRIFAKVTPYDGKDWGDEVTSDEIVIGGMSPKILSLQVAPESLYVTTPQVVITALAEDPDNDEVRIVVHWMIHDNVLPDTSNELSLTGRGLKKHDVITGSVFLDDGEFRSEPFPFELEVSNAPPVFRTITDSVRTKPDSIYYPLPIYDPDNDPLTYEILEAPDGIMVNEDGIVYGSAGDTEAFEIVIRAQDTEGAYLDAKFTLTAH
jgi:hypothetical protein